LLHQFECESHRQVQLPRADQTTQVALHFAVGFVVVVEVAVDVALIERRRVRDGLARRGDQLVGCHRHAEPGGELPEYSTVGLGQLDQNIHQFRYLPPGQVPAQLRRGRRLSSGWGRVFALGHGLDTPGCCSRRRVRLERRTWFGNAYASASR
jgi:hypothetical protein